MDLLRPSLKAAEVVDPYTVRGHRKLPSPALSRVRIVIEHAIGGMQRSNILVHTWRNRLEHFEDDVIGICAGLWNLVLSY